jgi:hypothetical protein
MVQAQEIKFASVIAPVSVGTTAVTGTFDTLDFDYATVLFHMATEATNSPILTSTLGFGTASNSFTLDANFTLGDTDNCEAITAPSGTSTPDINTYFVDLRDKERYAQVSLGNTQARICSVSVLLSRARHMLQTDAGRGVNQAVFG